MENIISETKEVFDWYKKEIQSIAKIVGGKEEHRKIVIKANEFLTGEDTGLPCTFKINSMIRLGLVDFIDLSHCYWINEAKRDKIRTCEYFIKKLLKEKDDKLADISVKYGTRISLKEFE